MTKHSVVIVGAGLAGLMMALYLERRNYSVTIYEKTHRPDLHFFTTSKSTDLNISQRACLALSEIDLLEQVRDVSVSTLGRVIYFDKDTSITLPHSFNQDKVIYNVNRNSLYKILLDAAQSKKNITIHFSHKLISANTTHHSYTFKSGNQYTHIHAPVLLGCDGVSSRLRDALNRMKSTEPAHAYIYKQYVMPQTCEAVFPAQWMYQWNDDHHVIVAHTDYQHQLNCTLVCKPDQIDTIYSADNTFLIQDDHPFNRVKSIKVPRQYASGILLIGDAAHGMLPFLGQGVNAAFEDCRLLNHYLDIFDDNWNVTIHQFGSDRQADTNAIIDMSAQEYQALLPGYDKQKQLFNDLLLNELHQRYAEFYPYRYLLAFTHLPYAEIMQIHQQQSALLDRAYGQFGAINQIDWQMIESGRFGEWKSDIHMFRRQSIAAGV